MRIVGYPKEFYHVARMRRRPLSEKALVRLRWLLAWQRLQKRGISGQEACRILALSRASVYRWQKRLTQKGLRGLEEQSRKPKHRRQRSWGTELVQAVLALREQYPRWGKDKQVILLHKRGFTTSASTVGRILSSLKQRNLLIEPLTVYDRPRKRYTPRPYARRKPREYSAKRPGELVQIDTLEIHPLPGMSLKHFTARDVISRWDVLEVHQRATAHSATHFLDTLIHRSPFPIQAVQVDGGSEFRAEFELACQQRQIQLFVLPPHSPKLNGHVERAHRTHQEEFYEVYLDDLHIAPLNAALQEWENTYNYIRPHQSLDGLTPAEYIQKHYPDLNPFLSHMY